MKKVILSLCAFICVLFFASCSKEQLKPAANVSSNKSVQNYAVNGNIKPPDPNRLPGTGGSSVIKKHIRIQVGVNQGSKITPTPPPIP